MEASEDFVVVNEKDGAEREALNRLQTLIDVFSKSIDALNQSNLLLKDELRSALSVTLQYSPTNTNVNIDELVKSIGENVTSAEEVRANYLKTLCSKLVAVDKELNEQRIENDSLKNSLEMKEKENLDQLKQLSDTVKRLDEATKKWITSLSPDQPRPTTPEASGDDSSEPLSLSALQSELELIASRVSNVDLTAQVNSGHCPDLRQSTVQATPHLTEVGVQQEDELSQSASTPASTLPPIPFFTTNPFHEDDWASSVSNRSDQDHIQRSQVEQSPSFQALDEEPWCPSCGQRFASRLDLEEHFPSCLE